MLSRSELTIILRDLVREAREGQYLAPQPPEGGTPIMLVRPEPRAPRDGEAELIARYVDRLAEPLGINSN